jgi:hypothetical protein
MRMMLGRLAVMVGLVSSCAGVAFAHHSFSTMYDSAKPVTLKGTVTKLEFRNPHIWVFLDVTNDGKAVNWGCEGGQPNQLFRNGWRPDSVKPGDAVVLEGFAARTGKPVCNLRNLTMANGKRIFAGQAGDGAPDPGAPGR